MKYSFPKDENYMSVLAGTLKFQLKNYQKIDYSFKIM